jgi:hypothetical protein
MWERILCMHVKEQEHQNQQRADMQSVENFCQQIFSSNFPPIGKTKAPLKNVGIFANFHKISASSARMFLHVWQKDDIEALKTNNLPVKERKLKKF